MLETFGLLGAIGGIVGVGVATLPWSDAELRASARGLGTLASLPRLLVALSSGSGRRAETRSVSAPA
jgi:hypothetical protein